MEAIATAARLTCLQARGFTTIISEKLVPLILSRDLRAGESGTLSQLAVAAWDLEKQQKQPSLARLLTKLFPSDLIIGLFGSFLWSASCCVIRPLVLKLLVDAANKGDGDKALMWAGVLVLVLFFESIICYVFRHHCGVRFASGILGSFAVLIQRKGLQLAPGVAGETTERTLLNNDVIGLAYNNMLQLHLLPACVMSAIFGAATIVYAIGLVGLIGLTTLTIALVTSMKLAGLSKIYEKKRVEATSLRLGVTARTLNSIKAVKFCAWEDQFLSNIFKARQAECGHLRNFRTLQSLNASIGRVTPVLCAAVTYIVLAARGTNLEPGDIFAVLSVFQSLRLPLILIPLNLTYLASTKVAFERVKKFLLLPDSEILSKPAIENMAICVEGEKVAFSWPAQPGAIVASEKVTEFFALHCGNLKIQWGTRCAVVGAVGAGKSSLLCTFFGGLSRNGGQTGEVLSADLNDVGYVPQRAFVVSGTVLQNVVFGRAWDPLAFSASVYASALDADLSQLPNGKDTDIGEQGVTLSGGQKQRINIARAVYGCPKLLVLDDPLAAVDMKVARQIFNRVVLRKGGEADGIGMSKLAPQGQSIVMALNQFPLLHKFDHVVYLDSGKIVEQGSPQDLCASGGDFAKFVNSDIGSAEDTGVSLEVAEKDEEAVVQKQQNLVIGETRNAGFINTKVYKHFFSNMGCVQSLATVILFTIAYGSMGFTDMWLKIWVEEYSDSGNDEVDDVKYSIVYACATVSFLVFQCLAAIVLGRACVSSSRTLHDTCMSHLLRAPVSFFEETPSGRLLSRFGADLAQVDMMLAMMVDALVTFLFTLLVLTVTICVLAPPMIAIMIIAGAMFLLQCVAQDRTSREVKRMANNSLSPTLNLVGELNEENARILVRAMKFESRYTTQFASTVDVLNNYNMVTQSILLCGALYAYILAFVVAAIAAVVLLKVLTVSAADIGLALTYAFMLPYFMQVFAQVLLLLNVSMTALERMLQTQDENVSQEPSWKLSNDAVLVSRAWPTSGRITFSNVSLVYRVGLPPALQDCTFEIPGGEKIGVVGRTGAGKSSLFVLLFRIVDAASGTISVDDVPVNSIGLHTLRAKMAIIPQEPLLLEGSLRINIDPFEQHSDEEIDAVFKRVGLVGSDKQPTQLSFGERQLLQMARTLLRKVSIVVMDEPTSNIDPNTDETLQRVVREDFSSQTVVTIAHRLDTVIDNDKIMVLDAGRLVEYGAPKLLLQNPSGHLTAIVDGQGERKAKITRERLGSNLPEQSARGTSDVDAHDVHTVCEI